MVVLVVVIVVMHTDSSRVEYISCESHASDSDNVKKFSIFHNPEDS